MRILADTNIFIDFWNNPADDLVTFFSKEEIVICGIIRAELLHGACSDKNLISITN